MRRETREEKEGEEEKVLESWKVKLKSRSFKVKGEGARRDLSHVLSKSGGRCLSLTWRYLNGNLLVFDSAHWQGCTCFYSMTTAILVLSSSPFRRQSSR